MTLQSSRDPFYRRPPSAPAKDWIQSWFLCVFVSSRPITTLLSQLQNHAHDDDRAYDGCREEALNLPALRSVCQHHANANTRRKTYSNIWTLNNLLESVA